MLFFCHGLSCKILMSSIRHKTCTVPLRYNKDVLTVNFVTPRGSDSAADQQLCLFAYKKRKSHNPAVKQLYNPFCTSDFPVP